MLENKWHSPTIRCVGLPSVYCHVAGRHLHVHCDNRVICCTYFNGWNIKSIKTWNRISLGGFWIAEDCLQDTRELYGLFGLQLQKHPGCSQIDKIGSWFVSSKIGNSPINSDPEVFQNCASVSHSCKVYTLHRAPAKTSPSTCQIWTETKEGPEKQNWPYAPSQFFSIVCMNWQAVIYTPMTNIQTRNFTCRCKTSESGILLMCGVVKSCDGVCPKYVIWSCVALRKTWKRSDVSFKYILSWDMEQTTDSLLLSAGSCLLKEILLWEQLSLLKQII